MNNLDAAEAAFTLASQAGDQAAIDAATAIIDAHDHKPTPTLLSSALWYASVGLHVFPLSPGTKIPYKGSRGCLDATTEPDQITEWWTRNPDANIGIATGHVVDVVDVDGHAGQRSRVEHWDDLFAQIDADSIGKVLTPRIGGLHLYVPATGDGNSTNIVPSVDYRGVGGFVVAPPSRNPDGRYRWLGTPDLAQLAERTVAILPDKRTLCPYRHTTGSSIAPWVLGENEDAEVILLRNGQRQVKMRCRNCGTAGGALPKQAVIEWMSDLGAPIVRRGNTAEYPACSYRGCDNDGVDMHHFAPRNTFGRDADNWPVTPLCKTHHQEWHQRMNGYLWHRKAAS